jgi:hypothetical protein
VTAVASLRRLAFAALVAMAGASIAIGTLHALEYSQDLQWDEARLFLEGVNPYLFFLQPGRPLPDYINPGNLGLTQMPSAVLLFAPIALPSFETAKVVWIFVNLGATPVFVLLLVRLFYPGRLGASAMTALTLLFIASMPWRVTIGNGQYCLVAMVLFLMALHFFRERRLGLATLFSALALVKYTLVLPFFALFLHRKKDTALVLAGALLIHTALTVAAGLLVSERPDVLIRQSLTVAASITEAGAYDFFAFQARVAPEAGRFIPLALSALTIALTVAMCWKGAGLRELAAFSIVSIIIVYHRSYDAIVLMFLVLHLIRLRTEARAEPVPLDRAEFHLGCAVVVYVFALDQFVLAGFGPEAHAWVGAGFSALLYAYLGLLFFRSFAERKAVASGGGTVSVEA